MKPRAYPKHTCAAQVWRESGGPVIGWYSLPPEGSGRLMRVYATWHEAMCHALGESGAHIGWPS